MEMLKSLIDQVEEFGAGEGHASIRKPFGKDGFIAVISVYKDQRPSHEILSELYDWSETHDEQLKVMIEELSKPREEEE